MARRRGVITTEGEVATGTSKKTLLQLVPASNSVIALKGFSVSFNGTTVTNEPVNVDIYVQTDAGTSSAATVQEEAGFSGLTFLTAGRKTVTAEPTGTTILRSYFVHPQTGLEVRFSPEDEILMHTNRLALVVTAPNSVNAVAHMIFEE